jgi:hypothetical protein
MELDKITVRAVEILADATARAVGTGSIVYLKLTRAVSVRSEPALIAAKTEFNKLPGSRRASIRTDAVETANKLANGTDTLAAIDAMFKPLAQIGGNIPRLVVRNS